jgi:hypothetical protein
MSAGVIRGQLFAIINTILSENDLWKTYTYINT